MSSRRTTGSRVKVRAVTPASRHRRDAQAREIAKQTTTATRVLPRSTGSAPSGEFPALVSTSTAANARTTVEAADVHRRRPRTHTGERDICDEVRDHQQHTIITRQRPHRQHERPSSQSTAPVAADPIIVKKDNRRNDLSAAASPTLRAWNELQKLEEQPIEWQLDTGLDKNLVVNSSSSLLAAPAAFPGPEQSFFQNEDGATHSEGTRYQQQRNMHDRRGTGSTALLVETPKSSRAPVLDWAAIIVADKTQEMGELDELFSEIGRLSKIHPLAVRSGDELRTQNVLAKVETWEKNSSPLRKNAHSVTPERFKVTLASPGTSISSPGGSQLPVTQPELMIHGRRAGMDSQQLGELSQTVLAIREGVVSWTPDKDNLPIQLAFQPLSMYPKSVIDLSLWGTTTTTSSFNNFLCLCPSMLGVLILTGSPHITDDAMRLIGERCRNLRVLHLQDCYEISDEGVAALVKGPCGPQLQLLDLSLSSPAVDRLANVMRACPRFDDVGDQPQHFNDTWVCFSSRFASAVPRITDEALRSVARKCGAMTALFVQNRTQVTDTGLYALARGCPRLVDLDTCGCVQISNDGASALAGFAFESVRMRGCVAIGDLGLHTLVRSSHEVRTLDLSGLAQLTDDGMRCFMETKVLWGFRRHRGYRNLSSLDLSGCALLTDLALSWVTTGCPSLQVLNLRGCVQVHDLGLRAVGTLHHLALLVLSGCVAMSDTGIKLLCNNGMDVEDAAFPKSVMQQLPSKLSRMRQIDLSGCSLVSDVGAVTISKAFPSLRHVSLAGLPHLSNSGVRTFAHALGKRLHSLDLTANPQLRAEGLGALAQRCVKLRRLHIHDCASIRDDAVRAISKLRYLTSLDLGLCRHLGDTAISHIPNWLLQNLSLRSSLKLSDTGIEIIAIKCLHLRRLDVARCERITDTGVRHFTNPASCPELEWLHVNGCSQISTASLRSVASTRPALFLVVDMPANARAVRSATQDPNYFVGVRPARFAKHEQHQRDFVTELKRQQHAALVLQCRSRTSKAQRDLNVLRRARFAKVTRCSVQIQRVARGFVARRFAVKHRRQLVFLATRLQFMWRWRCLRAQRKRALQFWMHHSRQHAFSWWEQCAREQREEREEQERIEEEIANHERIVLATTHWSLGLRARVLREWHDVAREQSRTREGLAKAAAFWGSRETRLRFNTWQHEAHDAAVHRRRLVVIFLNCVSLESHNSRRQKSDTYMAESTYNRFIRRRAFRVLRHSLDVRREKYLGAAIFSKRMFTARTGRMVFRMWRLSTVHNRRVRALELQGQLNYQEWQRRRALKAMVVHVVEVRQHRVKVARAMRMFLNRTKASVMRTWRDWIKTKRQAEEKSRRVSRAIVRNKEARCFRAWAELVRIKNDLRQRVQKCMNRISQNSLSRAWLAWRAMVQERAAVRYRVSQTWSRRSSAAAFQAWIKYTGESKLQRRAQLVAWQKLQTAATCVQAIWRGMSGRAAAEDSRLVTQLMVVRIQSLVRMHWAQKRRWRMERYATLRSFMRAEQESNQMELEETYGITLRVERRCALVMQRQWRARVARNKALQERRAKVLERAQTHRFEVTELMEEHLEKEHERELFAQLQDREALRIQSSYRALIGRRRFHAVWLRRLLDGFATKIQAVCRTRIARRMAEGNRRAAHMRMLVMVEKRNAAKMMRRMKLHHREQQQNTMKQLDKFGMHPETFTFSVQRHLDDVRADAQNVVRLAEARYQVIMQGATNGDRRQKVRAEYQHKLEDSMAVKKGDVVQIVAKDNVLRGRTGHVLDLKHVPGVPGGKQAAVKMDHDQTVLYVSIKTVATSEDDSTNSMIRFQRMPLVLSSLAPHRVINNRNALLLRAQELAEDRRQMFAASLIQRLIRGRKMRAYVKVESVRQREYDEKCKAKLLAQLTKYKIANARTGRLLVKLGLVWPRHVPDMPETTVLPKSLDVLLKRHHLHTLRAKEVKHLMIEQHGRVRAGKMKAVEAKIESDLQASTKRKKAKREATTLDDAAGKTRQVVSYRPGMGRNVESLDMSSLTPEQLAVAMRWRRRNGRTRAWFTVLDTITDGFLGKLAQPLDNLSFMYQDSGILRPIFKLLTRVVGGPEFGKSHLDRSTWVGMYIFAAFAQSPHVTAGGNAMYHGPWQGLHPNGRGYAFFAGGEGYGRKERARTSEGVLIPQYEMFLGQFAYGVPKGLVTIRYLSGSIYTGEYVPEEEAVAATVSAVKDVVQVDDAAETDDDSIVGDHEAAAAEAAAVGISGDESTAIAVAALKLDKSSEYARTRAATAAKKKKGKNAKDDIKPVDGEWVCADGTKYIGRLVDNHFNEHDVNIDNVIRMTPEGNIFTGRLVGGLPDGNGEMRYANRDVYHGYWENGARHGQGTLRKYIAPKQVDEQQEDESLLKLSKWSKKPTSANKKTDKKSKSKNKHKLGSQDDEQEREALRIIQSEVATNKAVYTGGWAHDEKSGFGAQSFEDGSTFEGHYDNSMWEGEGRFVTKEGHTYIGEFHMSDYHGYGEIKYSDGSMYAGLWRHGQRHTGDQTAQFIDSNGDVYEVAYVHDLMDGKGKIVKAGGMNWHLEEYVVFRAGAIVNKLGVGTNPIATDEFCSKFVYNSDYETPFALIVAQQLPQLPDGVDATDRRVEQHVAGIIARAGELAGASVEDRCHTRMAELLPQLANLDILVEKLDLELEDQLEEEELQEEFVEEQREKVEGLEEQFQNGIQAIEDFWLTDPSVSRLRFKETVQNLNKALMVEWFNCAQVRRPTPIWTSLWTGLAQVLGIEATPLEFNMLCKNSKQNEELGDKMALVRTYDVKLLDEVKRWNVYHCAQVPMMVEKISVSVYNPGMKPENLEISLIAPVAASLVLFLQAAFQYIKKSKEILKQKLNTEALTLAIDFETVNYEDEVQALKDERDKTVTARKQLNDALVERQDVQQVADELNMLLAQTKQNLARGRLAKERGLPPSEALIQPWLSREEEQMNLEVEVQLEEMIRLVEQPDLWDCLVTIKETIVSQDWLERTRAPTVPYIEWAVIDTVHDIVNWVAAGVDMDDVVAGVERHACVEADVIDVMAWMLDLLGGTEPEVTVVLDEVANRVAGQEVVRLAAELLERQYVGHSVMVFDEATGYEYTAICLSIYTIERLVEHSPLPGTGLVYFDAEEPWLHGFEGDAKQEIPASVFTKELEPGFQVMVPTTLDTTTVSGEAGADGDGDEETAANAVYADAAAAAAAEGETTNGMEVRTVVSVSSDRVALLDWPFTHGAVEAAGGAWSREWAFRVVRNAPEVIECQLIDVRYDIDQSLEYSVDLSRVRMLQ